MTAIGPTVMLATAIAAIACVPALFIAGQLKKSRGLSRMPVWPFALTLALSLVVTAAVRPYALDRYRVWYVDTFAEKLMAKFENQQPVYGVIRQHDPALYAEVRAAVLDGLKHDVSSEELNVSARRPIEAYVDKFMFQVPDQEFLQFMAMSADLTAALSAANPALCVDMIMGKPYGDLSQYTSKELADREVAATEALVKAPKSADQARLPPDDQSCPPAHERAIDSDRHPDVGFPGDGRWDDTAGTRMPGRGRVPPGSCRAAARAGCPAAARTERDEIAEVL